MSRLSSLSSTLLNTITVPKDLHSVESWDPAAECDPQDVGMTAAQVEGLWECVRHLYRKGNHPAITLCLHKQGRVVLNRAIGHARGNGPEDGPDSEKTLITTDTPIGLFSASKAITAMLVHLLAEQGHIRLHDPIATYIPEFGQHKKERITIYQLLSHQGGFPTALNDAPLETWFDHQAVVERLCNSRLTHVPGKPLHYHAVTGGHLFAEIVQRVTGKNIADFLQESIARPLGLQYLNYGVSAENLHKVALNYCTGYSDTFPLKSYMNRAFGYPMRDVVRFSNDPRFLQAIVPSAGVIASTRDTAMFFELLLNGGTLDGVRIFKPETIREAIRPAGSFGLDRIILLPMRYSAGMMLGNDPFGLLYGPWTGKAFGHMGFTNMMSWADPSRDISVTFLNTGKALFGLHLPAAVAVLNRISSLCPVLPEAERRSPL